MVTLPRNRIHNKKDFYHKNIFGLFGSRNLTSVPGILSHITVEKERTCHNMQNAGSYFVQLTEKNVMLKKSLVAKIFIVYSPGSFNGSFYKKCNCGNAYEACSTVIFRSLTLLIIP